MVKIKNKTQSRTGTNWQAERVGIFGASGCGKTTKARELTAGLGRVVFFDPLAEWAAAGNIRRFYRLDDLKKALIENFMIGFRFALIPAYGEEEKILNDLSLFLAEYQKGYGIRHAAQVTLVVDELDQSFPTGILQRNRKHGFGFICCRGRHFGINIIGISQRMHLVDNVFRANCSALYLFRHSEPADIDTGLKILGREYRESFQNLPNYAYFYKKGGQIIKKTGK